MHAQGLVEITVSLSGVRLVKYLSLPLTARRFEKKGSHFSMSAMLKNECVCEITIKLWAQKSVSLPLSVCCVRASVCAHVT